MWRELFSRKERKERKDCGRVDVGDVLTQRRRDAEYAEMFSRVEHVDRAESFSRKERKGRKDLNHGIH